MSLQQRCRNLIAAFETERAEIDILLNEVQRDIDTLPVRLFQSATHEALHAQRAALDRIHARLNDTVFDLYFLIGEKKDGQ